jgi:hypothetical protein
MIATRAIYDCRAVNFWYWVLSHNLFTDCLVHVSDLSTDYSLYRSRKAGVLLEMF